MAGMEGFLGEAYTVSIVDLFHDICIDDLSYRGKIILVRSYAEIIVRKLLDIPNTESVMLGSEDIRNALTEHGMTEKFFKRSLEKIRKTSNDIYHTKKPKVVTEKQWNKVFNALLNLYAYLFYRFFKQHTFGSSPEIVSTFSLLPPVIRRITLEQLFAIDPYNELIIDKLILAIRKDAGMGDAQNWIEINVDHLRSLKIRIEIGDDFPVLESDWYEAGYEKLQQFANWTPLYQTMQEAKSYYEHNGILPETTDENKEFNDLMQFVFLGW